MSQNGSTVYPFNGEQVRTMARVKLAYENVLDQNKTLHEMMAWCDSVMGTQVNVIEHMDHLIVIKQEKIANLHLQNTQVYEMYELSGVQVNKEKKLKWIFVGTTTLVAGFLALSLF